MFGLNYHQSFILSCLRKKPLDRQEIIEAYEQMSQSMGLAVSFSDPNKGWTFHRKLDTYLEELNELGLVDLEGGAYSLTASGRKEAQEHSEKVNTRHQRLRSLLRSPKSASIISVFTNLALALLKLITGFVFNSMGLVADGFDSFVDVASAFTVFMGIRHGRELISSAFIILMMFGTAGYIGYEAAGRLISPEQLIFSPLTIIAALSSGVICYIMSIYQHYTGKHSGSISLLTQSVDSRNHTFQAVAVLIGLIFAAGFGLFIVDSIVALMVAVLIFKSAVELLLETVKLAREGELDTSRFGRRYEKVISRRRHEFFKAWILLILRDTETREGIMEEYSKVFAEKGGAVATATATRPMSGYDFEDQLDSLLKELEDGGLVEVGGERILLTKKGRGASRRKAARARIGIPV